MKMHLILGGLITAAGVFILIRFGFRCGHKNYSFPRTRRPDQRSNRASQRTGTYVVCLDCGREFPYDWEAMRIIKDKETQYVRDRIAPASS